MQQQSRGPRTPWDVERLVWLHFSSHLGYLLTERLVHCVRREYMPPRPQSLALHRMSARRPLASLRC